MIILMLVLLSYSLLVLFLWRLWQKALRYPMINTSVKINPSITVIIPIRNESQNIASLLRDLSSQTFRDFEIIVVDDHSNDNTADIVNSFRLHNLFLVTNEGVGKKQAITTAIRKAKGNVIITTDGDCNVQAGWVGSYYNFFCDEKVKFCFGPVRLQDDNTFFTYLQAIEFSSLIGSAAAIHAFGKPVMCNGANLAFRKDAFVEVKGYEGNAHIPSGDDEFLMRKIQAQYHRGIKFNNNTQAIVSTRAQATIKSFFSQRIRWAGKWKHNTSTTAKVLAVYVLLVQVCFISGLVAIAFSYSHAVLTLISLKVLAEIFFLKSVSDYLKQKWKWSAFTVLQLIYPFYVIITGVGSNFVGYKWKGR